MIKDQKLAVRPHGGQFLAFGGIVMVVGLVMVVIGLSSSPYAGYGPLAAVNMWKWPLTWAGVGAINLGVLLISIGTIVRALFFLPGRGVRESEFEPVAEHVKMTEGSKQ